MNTYYFTFGREGHPYEGGWVEIVADDFSQAQAAFATRFGYDSKGILRYSRCYPEGCFKETSMHEKGNFGNFCHERIVVGVAHE